MTVGEVGDPVLLSFNSCGSCRLCHDGHPAHCNDFSPLNFVGKKAFKSSESASDLDIEGSFFGQSSFASHSIVDERSVVNVKGLIGGEEDLIQLSPLGCGIQTGTGTILTVAEATEKDVVAVIGMGGVGLSAVMVSCRREGMVFLATFLLAERSNKRAGCQASKCQNHHWHRQSRITTGARKAAGSDTYH